MIGVLGDFENFIALFVVCLGVGDDVFYPHSGGCGVVAGKGK